MESPRWLLLSGAPREEAVAALERARGKYSGDTAAVEKEATAISQSLQAATTQAAGASGAPARTIAIFVTRLMSQNSRCTRFCRWHNSACVPPS